jgi:hypothetical protein
MLFVSVARTKQQIEQSIALDVEAENPGLDTVKGPIPDVFIRPQASQIRSVELRVDDLSKRYSLDYILTRNTAALELYGANHGMRKSPGRPAKGYVYFFTYTRLDSGDRLVIPAGTIISTSDTSISYQTTREAVMLGSAIDTFYNATKRRYEIRVPVASLGTGDVFDIPANRIKNIQSSIVGIDGVENREPIQGSQEAESNASFGNNIRAKFNGTAMGSPGGLKQLIQNFDTARILDVSLVFSSDYKLFRRRTRRAAWDVYVLGDDSAEVTETFQGNGTKTEFPLTNRPVLDVSKVLVNGISVPYALERDTSDQTQTSTKSEDKIVLSAAPNALATVEVTYTYDVLMTDTQAYVDQLQNDLYKADILVRKGLPVNLAIEVSIQVLSTFDEAQAEADTLAVIQDYTNVTKFIPELDPNELRTRIQQDVSGISAVRVTVFQRLDTGTLPAEVIPFEANEYPVVDDANINITVRR